MKYFIHKTGNQSGFTLIEMLIALSIFSIIGLAIFSLMKRSLSTLSTTEYFLEAHAEKYQFERTLYNDLGNILLFAAGPFSGQRESLQFTTCLINDSTGKEPIHIAYELRQSADSQKRDLIRRCSRFRGDEMESVICQGIEDIHFDYLHKNEKNAIWQDEFKKKKELPVAVRLSVKRVQHKAEEFYYPVHINDYSN